MDLILAGAIISFTSPAKKEQDMCIKNIKASSALQGFWKKEEKMEKIELSRGNQRRVADVVADIASLCGIMDYKVYTWFPNGHGLTHVHCGACLTTRPSKESTYFTLEYRLDAADKDHERMMGCIVHARDEFADRIRKRYD